MKVSIIVPTYKDIEALELILDALQLQTYKNFEVIIAEDDNIISTKYFLETYDSQLKIRHFTHEDKGNRKAFILNKSLVKVEGEYIIFIDGDCIPYTTFIESHILLASRNTILCGRRVNLGDKVSKDLRAKNISAQLLERGYLRYFKYLVLDDNSRHYEQGFYFSPNSFVWKYLSKRDENVHIVGSNFSCYKEAIYKINGFDEDIVGGSKDDVDLEWRFEMAGYKLRTCKFTANLFHLNHVRTSRIKDEEIARMQMQTNKINKQYIAFQGINTYEP